MDGGRPVGDGGDPPNPTRSSAAAPTTTGGEGRVTVAVARSDVEPLLDRQRAPFVVTARGTHREFEVVALLRQAGKRLRTVTIGPNSTLVDVTLEGATVGSLDVAVVAVRTPNGELDAIPKRARALSAGETIYAIGRPDQLRKLERAANEPATGDETTDEAATGDGTTDGEATGDGTTLDAGGA